jgi:hypothetical protein
MRTTATNKYPVLGFSLLVIILQLVGCSLSDNTMPMPSVQHIVKARSFKSLWLKNNVYVVWNGFSPMLGATLGKVCFLGGLNNDSENNLTCLDSKTGDLLWRATSGTHTAFYARSDGLYVAYSGMTGVRKYSLDGKIIWSKSLLANGSVYLQSFNDQIHVLVNPDTYYLLKAETGELIRKIEKQNIIYHDDNQYVVYLSDLRFYSTSDQKIIWSVNLDNVLELAPLLTKDIVMLRTGRVIGSAYAIDRQTGKVLWITEPNIISTIAYSVSNKKAYFFSRDGRLTEKNISSGQEVVIAQFENQDFKLNGDAAVGGYEVSLDEANRLLYLYLGDSRQLFTFQMN